MSRFRVGIATVVMLVILRVAIGWHFFSEGMSHYHDPEWSSEPFLRAAKGPLAGYYQAVLPNPFAWNEPDPYAPAQAPAPDVEAKPVGAAALPKPAWERWADDVTAQWQAHRAAFDTYGLSKEQKLEADRVFERYKRELRDYLSDAGDDVQTHLREVDRLARLKAEQSAEEVPYQKTWIADKEKSLRSEGTRWNNGVKEIQDRFHAALARIPTEQQQSSGAQSTAASPRIAQVDRSVTYMLIAVGGCLIVGLFTRLAALAGALFLLSIILSQPPWLAGTQPSYNQIVESVALLTLSSTRVGRWAGLDFFLHHLIMWPFRRGHRK